MDIYRLEDLSQIPSRSRDLSIHVYVGSEAHRLTDEELGQLPPMPELESLHLAAADEVTVGGMTALAAKTPKLRRLGLQGGEGLGKGVAAMAAAWDGLEHLRIGPAKLPKAELKTIAGLGLKSLELRSFFGAKSATLSALSAARGLERLQLHGLPISEADAEAIASLPALTTLRLHPGVTHKKFKRHDVAPRVLEALAGAPALERFDPGRPLTGGEADGYASHASLRQLVVHVRDLEQLAGLGPLGRSELELILAFEDIDLVTDELLGAVAEGLPGVVSLELHQGGRVDRGQGFTAEGLSQLGRLSRLRRLFIRGGWKFKNDDLAFLEGLTELEVLELRHLYKLTAGIAGTLVKLSKLRLLELGGITMTDGAAKKLAKLPLEAVSLDLGKIGDKGLAALATVKTLERLGMTYRVGEITDAGLMALAGHERLEELSLKIQTATAAGFEALAQIPSLKRLQIHVDPNSPVEDAMVRALASAPALEELGFAIYCNLGPVTDAAITAVARNDSLLRLEIPKPDVSQEVEDRIIGRTGNDLFHVEPCPDPRSWLD